MDNRSPYTTPDKERERRRSRRIAARKQRERERRIRLLRRYAPALLGAALLLVVVVIVLAVTARGGEDTPPAPDGKAASAALHLPIRPSDGFRPIREQELGPTGPYAAVTTDATVQIDDEEIISSYAVVIDLKEGVILAERDAFTAVSPASMTKILTVLVAAEHVSDLDDTFTITREITDYTYVNGCSVAGFKPGEEVTLRDLFYGTILPSGADAALALAIYVAGSHEAFVELMNEKARELELSEDAHFANCVGIYDPGNLCSVYDIARILKAALDNDICRDALTRRTHTIPTNDFHDKDLELNNWFVRQIEDYMPDGVQIMAGKTGYVKQAGNCAASCAQGPDGRLYLCVTAKANSRWTAIYDHAALYERFVGAQADPDGVTP